ncbi:MAG TPA: glycosyltransferase family 2 protein [Thermoanaerobaculia bacterium]|nr:glycosyltransferase family 2 protein [Thermoanaerobaculia bacterium]
MPCLNEADTLAICIHKAQRALAEGGIAGEVIVADNGSTDGSQAIAEAAGARLVAVPERGYGAALAGGIAAARGSFVVMGDADDSYDFLEIPAFVTRLREGHDLVQGCRLPAGGGRIAQGAMPFLHQWLGNPVLTALVRWWFRAPIHDVYCGLRGFRREWLAGLGMRSRGMEFATEMIIRASLTGASIAEVPITLHPDGRLAHPPHLRTFRDGWRTLRFFLLCTPRWLFLVPGLALVLAGLVGFTLALPGWRWGRVAFDAHTLLYSSLGLICGYQSLLFAVFAKTVAVREGLLPPDPRLTRFHRIASLERSLLVGLAAIFGGTAVLAAVFLGWREAGFGHLDYATTMRRVIPAATATALGFTTVLAGFFSAILGVGGGEGQR